MFARFDRWLRFLHCSSINNVLYVFFPLFVCGLRQFQLFYNGRRLLFVRIYVVTIVGRFLFADCVVLHSAGGLV